MCFVQISEPSTFPYTALTNAVIYNRKLVCLLSGTSRILKYNLG